MGLISFTDADDFDTWELRVDPIRQEPDPALLDEFVATQLSDAAKAKLAKWAR